MEHVAIMKKSWGLLPKIVSGQKTIESRWLMNRSAPWNKVSAGDVVYFKNSGEPVEAKAVVSDIRQFADLTPARVSDTLDRYDIAMGLLKADLPHYKSLFRGKNYVCLIFLQDAEQVEPFYINKHGFGLQVTWLTVPSVRDLAI